MNQPTTFARHFGRLVWLLANEPASMDLQKGALRAITAIARDGPIRMSVEEGRLSANVTPLPEAFAGVTHVRSSLGAQRLSALEIATGASPSEILTVARALAAPSPARDTLASLRLASVRFEGSAVTTEAAIMTEALATADSAHASGQSSSADDAFLVQDTGAMFTQFMSASRPIDPAEILFSRVDEVTGSTALAAPLEELVNVAEQNGREGRASLMADIFAGLVKREAAAADDSSRRAFAMAIRRISTSFMLKAVAGLLPHARSRADDYRAVLVRAGADGADALIDKLSQAQSSAERRIYFDVLLTLGEGIPALIHMLGDSRWFVVRNAAELLGEMRAVEAEAELTAKLRYPDERVRRIVKEALARLGTPTALRAIEAGLRDPDPTLRQEAAAALAARPTARTAQTIIRALESEEDLDVQLAMLAALGKVGSDDAVQQLQRAAEPESRLFRRKPTPVRIAAVHALAEVKSGPALAAIATLTDDKDREVRELASRALDAASRVSAP